MAGNSADAGRSVTSKVISMLMTFAKGSDFSLTEIAHLAGVPVSTAHRLVNEMAAWGILERSHDGQFWIGSQLRAIASAPAPLPAGLPERARPLIEDLATASSGATIRLGVLNGLEVRCIETDSAGRAGPAVFGHATLPIHATAVGRALLAFCSAEKIEQVIAAGLGRYTSFTVTSPDRLRRSLSTTRLTRVAITRRELDPDTCAVAVPVFSTGGVAVAALEMSLPEPQDPRLMQPTLIVAARCLSRELQAAVDGATTSRRPCDGHPHTGLACRVEHDCGVLTVAVDGALTMRTASAVHGTLVKCLTDSPAAIVVDLAGMTVDSDLPLTVFPSLARRAAQSVGVPVVLCAAPTQVVDRFERLEANKFVRLYDTRAQAVAAVGRGPGPFGGPGPQPERAVS